MSVNGNSRMAFGSGTEMKIKLRILQAYVCKVHRMIDMQEIIGR